MSKDLWLRRIRNYAGLLGGLLPFLSILSVLLIRDRPETALYSISATYYLSPALAVVLGAASVVLMCYDGYSLIDNVVTCLAGVFGIMIVLFPCSTGWIAAGTRVGFFQIPVEASHIVHCASAAVFFILLSFNCLFLFTRTGGSSGMTRGKRRRNIVYRVCGIGMLVFMAWQVVTANIGIFPGWWTMVNEIFLLFFFAVSWLTKGGVFLKD